MGSLEASIIYTEEVEEEGEKVRKIEKETGKKQDKKRIIWFVYMPSKIGA